MLGDFAKQTQNWDDCCEITERLDEKGALLLAALSTLVLHIQCIKVAFADKKCKGIPCVLHVLSHLSKEGNKEREHNVASAILKKNAKIQLLVSLAKFVKVCPLPEHKF